MNTYDSSENENVQQLRGLIRDYLGTKATQGTVSTIGDTSIDVTTGLTSTIIHNIPVAGGTSGLVLGDTVYLLYFGNQAVAINTRSFIGGSSVQGSAYHTHNDLYYTKAIVDGKLSGKSDIGHTHVSGELRASIGYIGGWTIDSTGIYQPNARLSGLGYIAFASTPATNWGYPSWSTSYGAWLGWDYGITDQAHATTPTYQNDPEGNATAAGPKLALYQDSSNYLVWTGTKLLIKAANFTLSGAGAITASAGYIGHWQIVSNKLQSVSGSIVMDADAQTILIGGGIILDGTNRYIRSVPFTAGVSGFNIDSVTGSAEFNNVDIRGEMHASIMTIDEVHAVGGSLLILPAAGLYAAITTI